ncbi:MAG: DUF4421 family protein [Bacteroidaceae bacterium]|nr:DUF4421 family protein [Bacteroidaceae bacterium]
MKRRNIAYALIFFLCACITHDVQAQKLWRMLKHNDSIMSQRYRSGNIDTLYITRPSTRWTLTGRINVSGAQLKMEGKQMGIPFRSEMTADYKSTISLGVNYLGVTLSMALNPAKLLGKYKDFEINLNSYNNRWGFDFIYQDARNFKGWHETEGQSRLELPPEVLTLKSLNVNAYYAFNHRRFSYPAAFTQSYIQRRSAGSFLLAVSGQGQRAKTKAQYESLLNVTNIGIGAGYGYNWVPSRHWLLHISSLPTFTVFSNTSLTVNDERIPLKYRFPEVIITARGAVIRQFGNMFVGMTMVYNFTNIGDENELSIHNDKWRTRLLVGLRL